MHLKRLEVERDWASKLEDLRTEDPKLYAEITRIITNAEELRLIKANKVVKREDLIS